MVSSTEPVQVKHALFGHRSAWHHGHQPSSRYLLPVLQRIQEHLQVPMLSTIHSHLQPDCLEHCLELNHRKGTDLDLRNQSLHEHSQA